MIANSSTGLSPASAGRPSTRLSSRRTDATRRSTPQSQGHALGGEGHLRAHGRPRLRRPVLRRRRAWPTRSHELEERLDDLAHAMREVCVLAARSPRDAEEMSSVLHVLSAIERMGNAAVDIARIVTHRLGIPAALVADLAAAEEVSHRVRVRDDSPLAHRSLADVELPDRGRHARRRDPARQGVDDRPRRRRHAAARRRAHPARSARGHRRAARARRRARVAPAGHRRRSRDPHRPRPRRRRARRDEERLRGRDRPRVLGAAVQRPEPRGRGEPPRGPPRRDARAARGVGAAQRRRSRSSRRRCAGCCTSARRPRSSATPRSRWCGWSRRTRRCTRCSPSPSATPTR